MLSIEVAGSTTPLLTCAGVIPGVATTSHLTVGEKARYAGPMAADLTFRSSAPSVSVTGGEITAATTGTATISIVNSVNAPGCATITGPCPVLTVVVDP